MNCLRSVTLNWTASVDTVDGYNIYRGTAPGQEGTKLDASPVTGTTFVDSTPLLGTSYYVVRSIVNGLESVNSNEITVNLRPAAPTNLAGTAN